MRKRVVLLGGAGLALLLLAGAVLWGVRAYQDRHRTDLERGLRLAPHAERYLFTDWADVRREVDAGRSLETLLEVGFERDLTSASALVESAPLLAERYGWSPLEAQWELYAQSAAGAVVTTAVPGSVSFDDLAHRLTALGYTPPAADDGVWDGGEELLARIAAEAGETGTPVLQYVVLDAEAGVVRSGDQAAYLAEVARGEAGEPDPDVAAAAGALDDPLSAVLQSGDQACAALAMSQADPSDQAVAERLLAQAGEVSPMTAYAMGAGRDGRVRVAMSFESAEQARGNADSRAVLAAGPAPGQGGDFADRFTVGEVLADDRLVTLLLTPVEGAFVLSDLGAGPVLFAAC